MGDANQPDAPTSANGLAEALSTIARNEPARTLLIAALRSIESTLPPSEVNVREAIIGPVIDALFSPNEVLRKELSTGLAIHFRYTSKIARDFLLAPDKPDHVWEPQTTRILTSLVRNARTAFVVGAYFGDQAALMAQAMRESRGQCYCFEINPTQVALLKMNADANDLASLIVVNRAVWSRSGTLLKVVGEDAYASTSEDIGDTPGLAAVALCDFGSERGVSEVEVLAIDIEGGELAVLEGASCYLEQPSGTAPNIVFEVHRTYVDWSGGLENTRIAKYLQNVGYTLFAIRDYQGNVDMTGHPVELIPIGECYLTGPPHGFNVLAIKDSAIIDRHGWKVVRNVSPKLLTNRDPRLHQPIT